MRGEEEEEELRGGFGAEAVDDADSEDGALVVAEGEGVGLGKGGVGEETEAPPGVAGGGDEEGDAAARWGVGVVRVREVVAVAPEGGEDIDGKEDEGRTDEAFADWRRCVAGGRGAER